MTERTLRLATSKFIMQRMRLDTVRTYRLTSYSVAVEPHKGRDIQDFIANV
jgi:hypothetical protein